MGKLEVFEIRFSTPNAVFFPGSSISGDLFLQLNQPMNMAAIKLQFVGKARVHWAEEHTTGTGDDKKTETRHYFATENLFEQTIVIYGEGSVNGGNSVSQGQHSFPFNFQIPQPLPSSYEDVDGRNSLHEVIHVFPFTFLSSSLPSSYEDRIGYIRYYVKGTIVKPWKFDHNTKRVFTVLDSLDLNSMPDALMPGSGSESKTLCCWCCKSGPITVNFGIDRTGYVPGEWITINGELRNSSNSAIRATSVHIIQTVTYHATRKTKVVQRKLQTISRDGCGRKSSVTWQNEKLQIPPVPPSESQHCRIIDIHYSVQFEAHLRIFAINLKEDIPITIGTIPHRGLEMYREMAAEPSAAPSAPVMPATMPSAPPDLGITPSPIGSLGPPPPSYAAATNKAFNIKDEEDNEYTMGEATYIPQYTYYDWNKSAFTYNK